MRGGPRCARADGSSDLYGSDEMAAKEAGHALKASTALSNVDGVHLPLITLIDYKGFRLTAMALLPIDTRTLRYGCVDWECRSWGCCHGSHTASPPQLLRRMPHGGRACGGR